MAIKRVSDLQARTIQDKDLKILISQLFDSNDNLVSNSNLFKSKIEVSESIDDDNTQFISYAYDLGALSGIIIEQTLNHNIEFNGDKIFNGDTLFKGSVIIDTEKDKTEEFNINVNEINLKSFDNFSLNVENNVEIDNKNFSLNSSESSELVSPEIKIDTNTLNIKIDKQEVIFNNNEFKHNCPKHTIIYEDIFQIKYRNSNGDEIPVVVFSHDGNGNPTVSFNQTSENNPINGYINHALWS